jgi:hypothetical protein
MAFALIGAVIALIPGASFILIPMEGILTPPLIGQIANSLVAFGFIMAVGSLTEQHYAKRSRP